MTASMAMFGDWQWRRILYINNLLPIALADALHQQESTNQKANRSWFLSLKANLYVQPNLC